MDPLANFTVSGGVEIIRDDFIKIMNQATKTGNFRFIKQASEIWLNKYPNDLAIQYFLARSLVYENNGEKSIQLMKEICERDPEYLPAWEFLIKIFSKHEPQALSTVIAATYALGNNPGHAEIPQWGKTLREVRENLEKGNYHTADQKLQPLLTFNATSSLIEIYHLRVVRNTQDDLSFFHLAKIYHQRWPNCLPIALWLAESSMEQGEENEAVSLFHACAISDPAGQVAERMWGKKHDYTSIWPQELKIILDIPMPSQITVPLGWNQLPAGKAQGLKIQPEKKNKNHLVSIFEKLKIRRVAELKETINKPLLNKNTTDILKRDRYQDVEDELGRIAEKIKKPELKKAEGRFPLYVVLSTRKGLINKYGEKSAAVVMDQIKQMTEIINFRPGWRSIAFYPDDINCMRLFELDPILEIDPWKVKLALVDLDKYLGKKGEMIGCVLIVGGAEVVPFHSLPNPTDDKDAEVLSDNPYSTLDGNYFVPEWPIGRLPGEASNDPGLLLKQIRQIVEVHRSNYHITSWWKSLYNWFFLWGNISEFIKGLINKPQNYGYSTSVWRRSSLAAFRPIGKGNNLRVSPPFDAKLIDINNLMKSKYAYFNLHGLQETPDWYGQRDLTESKSGPDFPVAISTQQLRSGNLCPQIVFSEACYGGHIKNKNAEDSIALRFKDIWSSGFICSTCISYGSVYTPLIGADLLAFLFWKFITDGYTIGEALLHAKVSFIKIMTQRQGYLDGEDQKTLITFTLYGDPLAQPDGNKAMANSSIRSHELIKIQTVSDKNGMEQKEPRISGEVLNQVKSVLKEYLPGLENADVHIRHHQIHLDHLNGKLGNAGNVSNNITNRVMISYCKPVLFQQRTCYQYARVTLDKNGKMLKLVVSR